MMVTLLGFDGRLGLALPFIIIGGAIWLAREADPRRKRWIAIGLWSASFFLFGLAAGPVAVFTSFIVGGGFGASLSSIMDFIGAFFVLAPLVLAPLGAVLGLRGVLPGTGLRP